jgi:hypothetical protein
MPIGSRPRRLRLSIQLLPKPPWSMKQASACHFFHLRATGPGALPAVDVAHLDRREGDQRWCGKLPSASLPHPIRPVCECRTVARVLPRLQRTTGPLRS